MGSTCTWRPPWLSAAPTTSRTRVRTSSAIPSCTRSSQRASRLPRPRAMTHVPSRSSTLAVPGSTTIAGSARNAIGRTPTSTRMTSVRSVPLSARSQQALSIRMCSWSLMLPRARVPSHPDALGLYFPLVDSLRCTQGTSTLPPGPCSHASTQRTVGTWASSYRRISGWETTRLTRAGSASLPTRARGLRSRRITASSGWECFEPTLTTSARCLRAAFQSRKRPSAARQR